MHTRSAVVLLLVVAALSFVSGAMYAITALDAGNRHVVAVTAWWRVHVTHSRELAQIREAGHLASLLDWFSWELLCREVRQAILPG